MNINHFKALITSLGGDADELVDEVFRLTHEYPNMVLLFADLFKDALEVAQVATEAHQKAEILKDLLVDAGVVKSVAVPLSGLEDDYEGQLLARNLERSREMSDNHAESLNRSEGRMKNKFKEDEEILIDDIVWHLQCDEDLPN